MMAGPIDPESVEGQDPNAIDISLNLVSQGGIDAIKSLTETLSKLQGFMKQFETTNPSRRQVIQGKYASSALPPERRPPPKDNASRIPGVQWVDPRTGQPIQEEARGPFTARPIDAAGNPQLDTTSRPPVTITPVGSTRPTSSGYRGNSAGRNAYQNGPTNENEAFVSRPPDDTRTAHQQWEDAFDVNRPSNDTDPLNDQPESDQPESVSTPPPRKMDRALQAAQHLANHLPHRQSSLIHAALGMAAGAAALRGARSMGDAEGGLAGNGFATSVLGSMAAQSLFRGGGGGAGTGGASVAGAGGGIGGRLSGLNLNHFLAAKIAAGAAIPAIAGYMSGINRAGTELGYDRGPQLQVGPFGMQLPSFGRDSAFRQEIDRRVNAFRLRLTGGINGEQAQQITSSVAGSGYSGQAGEDVAYNSIAPLVRQGQDPRLASDMVTHAIRNGNTNLQDITQTLNDLGESARAARMTLSEYQQGLDEFAKSAEQSGALYGGAANLGRQITDSTGLTPQQATPILNSPIVQMMGFQHNGILPNAYGANAALDPQLVMENLGQTVDYTMQATRAFARPSRDANGNPIPGSARANQITQAAQFAGLPRETFQRILRNKARLPALGNLRAAMEQFGTASRATKNLTKDIGPKPKIPTGAEGGPANPEYQRELHRWNALHDAADGDHGALASQNVHNWEPVHKALIAAAPGKEGDIHDKKRVEYFRNIREIESKDDPGDRLKAARKLLRHESQQALTSDDRPSVKLDLTGPAKRLVRQMDENKDPAKREHGRGGKPVAEDKVKPDQSEQWRGW